MSPKRLVGVGGLRRRRVTRRAPTSAGEVLARLDRQHGRLAVLEREIARIGPQLAALEARFEDLRQSLETPRHEPGEQDEARTLVAEVRREHERVRARISAAARYEERLRQLEEKVEELTATGSDA